MEKWPNWITTQANTGSQYPYFMECSKGKKIYSFIAEDLLENIPVQDRELEISSVIDILHGGYIYGDKTLIKGIQRVPWLAKENENKDWEYIDIPKHGHKKEDTSKASVKIKSLLYQEILDYIGCGKKVGILLSGGLDSRIIAGVIREAQLKKDYTGEVIVYNWGIEDSRDVIYAKRIADLYRWEYKHYPLTADSLKDNISSSLMVGAEISPIHLHAMVKVRDDDKSDIILAGTYGDSLGRGLYSGTHFSNLKNMMQGNINKLGLIKDEVIKEQKSYIENDFYMYQSHLTDTKEPYQLREVEQNIHYLRRLLGTAMSIIAQKKPIYQLFTSPAIVEYIWGLDKSVRNDEIYKEILRSLPEGIGSIPYAKTGKSFININENEEDNYYQGSHKYGAWLRNDLKSFIDKELDFELLYKIGIFNEKNLHYIYELWPKATTDSVNKIDTAISWLTAFSLFLKKYDIQSEKNYSNNIVDTVNSIILMPKIRAYEILRNKLRK